MAKEMPIKFNEKWITRAKADKYIHVLRYLREYDNVTSVDVANSIGISPVYARMLLSDLSDMGAVSVSIVDADDNMHRLHYVYSITDKGKELLLDLQSQMRYHLKRMWIDDVKNGTKEKDTNEKEPIPQEDIEKDVEEEIDTEEEVGTEKEEDIKDKVALNLNFLVSLINKHPVLFTRLTDHNLLELYRRAANEIDRRMHNYVYSEYEKMLLEGIKELEGVD